jgi:uncharacterized membrane protein YqhA
MQLLLRLRYVMLVASLGAGVGALVMLWEGCVKLLGALRVLLRTGDEGGTVITFVMGATDAFLFAMVLLIFAYAIAFGFVLDLSEEQRERLPAWMRISTVSELKHTLVEVILVYLVVDFATDIAGEAGRLDWHKLVIPLSVLAIAAALRLLSGGRAAGHEPPG